MQVSFLVSICLRELGYASFPGEDAQDSDSIANRPFYPFLLMEVPELALVKLSMLFFYRRVFNTGGTPYINWATIVMLGIVSAWAVAYFFTFLFLCGGHPSNYWVSPVAEKAYCVKTQEVHLSFSISDMILDIFVLLLAFPAILRLQMSIGRRIAVLGIFLLGAMYTLSLCPCMHFSLTSALVPSRLRLRVWWSSSRPRRCAMTPISTSNISSPAPCTGPCSSAGSASSVPTLYLYMA